MSQHFIKIEIKGDQRNLPEKDDTYIVHRYNSILVSTLKFNASYKKIWLKEIDWYLSPSALTNVEEIYEEICVWLSKIFPDAGCKEHLIKLQEETNEVIADTTNIMEYADCLIALFGAAYNAGFTFDNLINALIGKHGINKSRKWVKNDNGTHQHVTEPQQPEQTESIREISKKIYQANHKDFFFTDSDEAFHKGIELGVEFASQSPIKAVIMPTEEDVMTYFNLHCRKSIGLATLVMTRSDVIAMSEWFRSQVREVELKEELVKFRDQLKEESGAFITDEYIEYYIDNRQSE